MKGGYSNVWTSRKSKGGHKQQMSLNPWIDLSEEEIKKCRDCKYNQPTGTCGFCISGSGTPGQMEERLGNLEKRLALLEQTEPVEKEDTPKLLLELFKFIGKIYSSEEVDKAIQLLRNEIAKAGEHYHAMPEDGRKGHIDWETNGVSKEVNK